MSDRARRQRWDRAVARLLTGTALGGQPVKESRAPGLLQPGGWLVGATMPARPVSAWGMAWRLTARWTATLVGGRVDAILRGSKFIELKKAIQFGREGGFAQANKDFDALLNGAKQVTRDGGLRTATLEDGTKINVRPYSSGDKPTLEIDTPYDDVPTIKIRY